MPDEKKGGNAPQEAAVVRPPKHIDTQPEKVKKSGGGQGNKRG